ncbi:hypothetical protein PFLUV_G00124350 [Perca fluviatilis]|uniref:Uncharacterized protein n=1 Tax=Perca fluviatilis TaxID=8168 RepID=A0A6A5F249_PERFL|nr:hypothetical protein PFLUV_G00124350 [Perca fluviatilis]
MINTKNSVPVGSSISLHTVSSCGEIDFRERRSDFLTVGQKKLKGNVDHKNQITFQTTFKTFQRQRL